MNIMKRPNLVFVLWVLFGFTLLFFITPRLFIHRGGKSPELLLILFSVVPLVWLIGGIVLGVICFRKSKQVGKWFYGVLGVLLFFFVADSFFGVSQQIGTSDVKMSLRGFMRVHPSVTSTSHFKVRTR